MYKIKIVQTEKEFLYEPGKTLLEILLSENVFVDNPCNGKGVCGKCKVRVVSGIPGDLSSTEKQLLKQEEIDTGVRLSCLIRPDSDMELELMQKERKHNVLNSGYVPEFAKDPDIRKQLIRIQKPFLTDQTSFEDQVSRQTECPVIPAEVLSRIHFHEGLYTAVLHETDKGQLELMALEEGDTSELLYGVAIDIGTTTVVTSLVNMRTSEEAANDSMINAQKHFGLDVLTRITYELENPEDGAARLQEAIVASINAMIGNVCRDAGIERKQIYEIAVGANSTMMHMLLGVDAVSIGKSPYAPMFVKARDIAAESIGLKAASGARLYCLPSVSSYIGADIVAGAYVCGLQETNQNVLFIDIGTNGEIVFSNHGELLCCSCAAGPALEGMNISSGMRACEGAIEDMKISEEGIHVKTIGDEPPAGFCGSGIMAAVKELIRTGIVRKDGAFVKPDKLEETDYRRSMLQFNGKKREFVIAKEPASLLVTQGDVRQVQLAKGAILSGFYALLNQAGKQMKDLDQVMIAGQFGAHLPADSLIGAGILPEEIRDKLVYVGNSSKTGAYMALMSRTAKREMEELAGKMEYVELGTIEGYERLFADCLIFPDIAEGGSKGVFKRVRPLL